MPLEKEHAAAKIGHDKVFILNVDALAHMTACVIARVKTASN